MQKIEPIFAFFLCEISLRDIVKKSILGWDGAERSRDELIDKIDIDVLCSIKEYWKQEEALEMFYSMLIDIVLIEG